MRKQEYVPDGKRVTASPRDIVQTWMRHSSLDPRYALGTGLHETSYVLNEKDTEDSGYISMGLYQIGSEEMIHVGMPKANAYDLEECTIVFAKLTDERFRAITKAIKHEWSQNESESLRAYLSIAHNQGLAACLKTIALHGMDWPGYKTRNLTEAQKALQDATELHDTTERTKAVVDAQIKLKWWRSVFQYGDDCVSGGPQWSIDLLRLAVA